MRHMTVSLSRTLPLSPEAVFDRWTDPGWRARFETPEGSGMRHAHLDTRAGGTETVLIEVDGAEVGRMIDEIRVLDRPHRILVQGRGLFEGACRMLMQTTFEVTPAPDGATLTGTSQIVTLDDHPTPSQIEAGWNDMFDRFAALIEEEPK